MGCDEARFFFFWPRPRRPAKHPHRATRPPPTAHYQSGRVGRTGDTVQCGPTGGSREAGREIFVPLFFSFPHQEGEGIFFGGPVSSARAKASAVCVGGKGPRARDAPRGIHRLRVSSRWAARLVRIASGCSEGSIHMYPAEDYSNRTVMLHSDAIDRGGYALVETHRNPRKPGDSGLAPSMCSALVWCDNLAGELSLRYYNY